MPISLNASMPTPSYLIPVGDLSLQERSMLRANIDEILGDAALRLKIKDNITDLVVRDTLPNTDLSIVGPSANADSWTIVGPGVLATELQYCNPAVGINQCIGVWGIGSPMAYPAISRIRFTLGAASTTVKGEFQLEQLYARLEPTGYFSTPLLYLRQDTMRVMVMPRIAFATAAAGGVGEQLVLLARTIEPLGVTISAPIF